MQLVELRVPSHHRPRSCWHLFTGLSLDLDNIEGILMTIIFSADHDRFDTDSCAAVQAIITLLHDILLLLHLFALDLPLKTLFRLPQDPQLGSVVRELGLRSE